MQINGSITTALVAGGITGVAAGAIMGTSEDATVTWTGSGKQATGTIHADSRWHNDAAVGHLGMTSIPVVGIGAAMIAAKAGASPVAAGIGAGLGVAAGLAVGHLFVD